MAMRNKLAEKETMQTSDGPVVQFRFANGGRLTCDPRSLPASIIEPLIIFAIREKVGNSYAGAESIGEAEEAARDMWDALCRGEYGVKSRGGLLASALAAVTGQSLDDCIDVIAKLDDKQKAKLKRDPRIAKAILKLQEARIGEATSDLDFDAMFDKSGE